MSVGARTVLVLTSIKGIQVSIVYLHVNYEDYHYSPKFLDTQNIFVFILKFIQIVFTADKMPTENVHVDGMAN